MKAILDIYLPYPLKELVAKIEGEWFLSTNVQMYQAADFDEDLLEDLREGENLSFKIFVDTSIENLSYSVSSDIARDASGRKVIDTIEITDIEITIDDDLLTPFTGRNRLSPGDEMARFELYEWNNEDLIDELARREIQDARLAA